MSRIFLRSGLLSFALVLSSLLLLLSPAAAFPYGKSSAVTELTPASFSSFVNTHKPVVVLFYAPWCGHCKRFHPEFERFAESVKGTMRVGAINADQYSNIGQQYGVRGFPTIKYWKMGTKSIASPQDYQGERTAAALQTFMVADITSAHVKAVATTEQLKQVTREAPQKRVGVVFSTKNKVPPMLSVMALSQRLSKFPLVFAGGCVLDKGLAQSFNVVQLPTIGVLKYTPAEGAGGEDVFELVPYPKTVVAYEPVAHFFLDCVENDCQSPQGSKVAASATAPTEARDAAAAPADLDEEDERHKRDGRDGHHHHNDRIRHEPQDHRQRHRRRQPPVALPVEAVAFTNETIANFCSPDSRKIRGRSPLCVISLTGHVNLTSLQRQFQNDPLLFFDAAAHREDVLRLFRDRFGVVLATDAAVDAGAVVLLRQGRPARMRHRLLEGMNSDSDLQRALQKMLNGELRLNKTYLDHEKAKEEE